LELDEITDNFGKFNEIDRCGDRVLKLLKYSEMRDMGLRRAWKNRGPGELSLPYVYSSPILGAR